MAYGDIYIMGSGGSDTNASSYSTTDNYTLDTGHAYIVSVHWNVGAALEAGEPTISDDASGTVTYEHTTQNRTSNFTGGTSWVCSVASQQTNVDFTFAADTETFNRMIWMVVRVENVDPTTLAQAIVEDAGTAVSGPPYDRAVSYGSTTSSSNMQVLVAWRNSADQVFGEETGWSHDDTGVTQMNYQLGPSERGTIECQWAQGAYTQASVELNAAGSASGIVAYEFEEAGGGGISVPVAVHQLKTQGIS